MRTGSNVEIETGMIWTGLRKLPRFNSICMLGSESTCIGKCPKSDYSVVMDYDYIDGNARKLLFRKLISAAREILQ